MCLLPTKLKTRTGRTERPVWCEVHGRAGPGPGLSPPAARYEKCPDFTRHKFHQTSLIRISTWPLFLSGQMLQSYSRLKYSVSVIRSAMWHSVCVCMSRLPYWPLMTRLAMWCVSCTSLRGKFSSSLFPLRFWEAENSPAPVRVYLAGCHRLPRLATVSKQLLHFSVLTPLASSVSSLIASLANVQTCLSPTKYF